jgi:hypothetical protein
MMRRVSNLGLNTGSVSSRQIVCVVTPTRRASSSCVNRNSTRRRRSLVPSRERLTLDGMTFFTGARPDPSTRVEGKFRELPSFQPQSATFEAVTIERVKPR